MQRPAKRPVHERVRDHVRRQSLTNKALAERTGFSEQRVYRLLKGTTAIDAEDMEILAEAIDVSVGELYHDPNPVPARRRAA